MTVLKERARKLGLRALVANWEKYEGRDWLVPLIQDEELERDRRSLERRIREAPHNQVLDDSWR